MSEAQNVEGEVEVRNRHGLHARPAAEFVKIASGFEAKVRVSKGDLEVNGKSIMGVLMLAAEPGSLLRLEAEGEDAREAIEALSEFLETDEEMLDPEEGAARESDGAPPGGAEE